MAAGEHQRVDAARLALLQDRLDLRTVVGNGAVPSVMRNAGADDADMIIAVTPSDQTNLVACKLAHTVFNVPTRLARLRSLDFLDDADLLLHVVDASREDIEALHEAVRRILTDLHLENKPAVTVLNKTDVCEPERVAALVYELEPQQHPANRGSVVLDQLVDKILGDAGYPLADRAAFEVPLKRAIKAAVAGRTDMQFVNGG
mgnify:CR=1 FL=1